MKRSRIIAESFVLRGLEDSNTTVLSVKVVVPSKPKPQARVLVVSSWKSFDITVILTCCGGELNPGDTTCRCSMS